MGAKNEKQKSETMLQRFISINQSVIPKFLLAVLLIIVTKLLNLLVNQYLGKMLDYVVDHKMQLFVRGIFLISIAQITKMILQYFVAFETNMLSEKCIRNMRSYSYQKLNSAVLSWLDKNSVGDLVTRINGDLDTFTNSISSFMTWQLAGWITFIVSVIGCGFINLKVMLISYSIIPVIIIVQCLTAIPISKYEHIRTDAMGKANSVFIDMMHGMTVTKAFNAYNFVEKKHDQYIEVAKKAGVKSFQKEFIMFPLQLILSILPQLLCVAVGSYYVIQGEITVGNMLSIALISTYGMGSVTDMAWQLRSINAALGVARRINDIWDVDVEHGGSVKESTYQDTVLEMKDVSFGYDENEILHHLNLSIKKGEKVALVGTSGSGKSTILKLVTGFYHHTSGEINMFGTKIQDWDLVSLRSHIAYLDQNPFLFSGSILSNVMLGSCNGDEQEAKQYIKEAGLFDKNIYEDIGENGALLSGGEKQRVCIARAMMKHADLILLDEPTSSLDGTTEQRVMESLDKVTEGKACLIIAHRFSTIQNADRIICMQNGQIVEEGTHETLMGQNGLYKSLYEKQSTGGK